MSTAGMPYMSWEYQRRRQKGVEETVEVTATRTYHTTILFLGIYTRAVKMYAHTKTCMPMLIAASFINKCPKLVTTQTFTYKLIN